MKAIMKPQGRQSPSSGARALGGHGRAALFFERECPPEHLGGGGALPSPPEHLAEGAVGIGLDRRPRGSRAGTRGTWSHVERTTGATDSSVRAVSRFSLDA